MNGRTLLGVWAHPDDEAYLSAGLMAIFRRRGDRVVVVTATAGELGTSDPELWPPHKLARLRRDELRASLATLDVHELRLLDHPDGGCQTVDGTDEIARVIDEVRPDLIVTFGPEGMTGHPDHRAVSRWTTDAWATLNSSAALWYATLTDAFHATWGPTNDSIGLWADQPEPPRVHAGELSCNLELNDELLDLKNAALRAHASQCGPLIELVGADIYREWWRTESFVAAPAPSLRGSDLVAMG